MTDRDTFAQLGSDLIQPDRGLFVVPIRHHSPACAWHLQNLIREVKPSQVLIEAPADFAPQIPLLLDADTKPPVALVALVDAKDKPRVAGYYPFCDHSPEYIALREGQTAGAKLIFIDAPAADKAMRVPPDAIEPVSFAEEHHFDGNDYTRALARAAGCRDGFELWDHLFEARLGGDDWRSFFHDVGVYCAGIREATADAEIEATGDANREAHMARAVKAALDKGGPVVVVVGGFHAPALVGDFAKLTKPEKATGTTDCYLIRYGFRALDALNGYGAGLPQPGYYQRLWEKAEGGDLAWRRLAIDLLSEFAGGMREQGHVIALPTEVEAIRMAEALAVLRGRPGAMRHDLIDGIRAALTKGEASGADSWTERFQAFLCGDKMGDVPPSAGSPPLVEDVRNRAQRLRFDITDSADRRRKLDIRRKDSHLEASRFCHAMALIGSAFASRQSGPDYLSGSRTELLFEEWSYAWSPLVEGHLIENAVLGDELPVACLALLYRERAKMVADGNARDLPEMVTLLSRGLLAGLGSKLAPFLAHIDGDIRNFGTFATVTLTLQKLMFVMRSTGPLGAPKDLDLTGTINSAYGRLVYLCDELPRTSEEQIDERLTALKITTEILRDCTEAGLDRTLLEEALDRVADDIDEPVTLGAVLAVCVQSGLRPADTLIRALEGRLMGVSLELEGRIGVLRGILHTSPMLLWHADGLLKVVDEFLCNIPEDQFLDLLPHLRLAFTALNPRDTDKLAHELAIMHQIQTGSLLKTLEVTQADLVAASEVEKALLASIQADGLSDWLLGGTHD